MENNYCFLIKKHIAQYLMLTFEKKCNEKQLLIAFFMYVCTYLHTSPVYAKISSIEFSRDNSSVNIIYIANVQ